MKQRIFLHIPKTAGSSVRTLIQQNYPADATIGFSGEPDSIAWYRSRLSDFKKQYALVHGHVPYGIHEGLTSYEYFTFLREPVARHFSDFDFLRRYEAHPLHEPIAAGRITATDWASIFEQQPLYRDLTTQYVSGESAPGEVDRLSLEKAKLHLRREFTLVGLAERFDESVLILAKRLGWRSIFYLSKNVTLDRTVLSDDMKALARCGLERDTELYQFAQGLFEESPELQDPAFAAALAEFRATRTWLEAHVANNPGQLFVVGQQLPSLDDLVYQHLSTPALDSYFDQQLRRAA